MRHLAVRGNVLHLERPQGTPDTLEDHLRASSRPRGLAYGRNIEVAPDKVPLLLEFRRRLVGSKPARVDAFVAQAPAQFP